MASSLLTRAGRTCVQTASRRAFPVSRAVNAIALFHTSNARAMPTAHQVHEITQDHKSRSAAPMDKEKFPGRGQEDVESVAKPVKVATSKVVLDPGAVATPMDMPTEVGRGVPFASLQGKVSNDTLKALTVKPFNLKHMSPVQSEVLPLLPQIAEPYSADPPADGSPRPPRDLLVKARTGTGKTLAFLVPAVEARLKAIDAYAKQAVKDAGLTSDKALEARAKRIFTREHVGTLIISPTRELATQIANEALRLTHHQPGFEVRLFVGGASKRMQMRDWMKGRRDIVVSTPGRLRDLLNSEPEVVRGLSKTQLFVLDEADTLLDMGFRDDIDAITEFLPKTPERQTFLFSATVSRSIQQVARATLDKNHVFINTVLSTDSPVHAHVPQYHTVLPSASEQIPHTLRLLAHDQLTNPGKSKAIVFLPTTKMTQLFATLLRELSKTILPSGKRTKVYEIHSKRTQESRTMTSDSFRADNSGASILVTSDVSARGVDYPGVTRVIQVGIPGSTDQYIHRVGRTGRAGTKGRGDLILLPWECGFVTWQLTEVPLKPLTVNELKAQVTELSEKYDADPKAAFASSPQILDNHGRVKVNGPFVYPSPTAPALTNMAQSIQQLLDNIDEEAIKETFASLLGYYMAKSPELRVQKGVIVQGCKDWTMESCGLPVPPYVSEGFLQKLGFSDGRTKRFGGPMSDNRERTPTGPSWSHRGQTKLRGRERETPAWARDHARDPNDPAGEPDEYKSRRYGDERGDRRSNNSSGSGYNRGGSGYGDRSSGSRSGFGRRDEGGNSYGVRR